MSKLLKKEIRYKWVLKVEKNQSNISSFTTKQNEQTWLVFYFDLCFGSHCHSKPSPPGWAWPSSATYHRHWSNWCRQVITGQCLDWWRPDMWQLHFSSRFWCCHLHHRNKLCCEAMARTWTGLSFYLFHTSVQSFWNKFHTNLNVEKRLFAHIC